MSDLHVPSIDDLVPSPEEIDAFHRRLHHIAPWALDPETAQTSGMRRLAAVSARTVGSSKLWMGQTHVAPATASANHHHGRSETAIYVVSGHPEFVFPADELAADDADGASGGSDPGGGNGGSDPGAPPREIRVRTSPGDYIFVPPWVPHREENPDPEHEALVVIARSTQDAIVVNLPDLRWTGSIRTTSEDIAGCS
ncbi:cupin domain-containing protein [Parafrankia discariae]|uniref:cupin domain-containing protein n=1 Tax=Parafrankia discariae TaxID=365528 RepID=UPI000363C9AC|nr:cupin domain-containing protein [Parafrankia discariae]